MAIKKKNGSKLGWHFLPSDMRLGYQDGRKAAVGQTLTMRGGGSPVTCQTGMHASVKPLDAIAYHKGAVMCRVRVSGEIASEDDKFCGRSRTVLWARELTEKDLRKLGKDCGITMPSYYTKDELLNSISHESAAHDRKVNDWLVAWTIANGCPDDGKVVLPLKKPIFDGAALLQQLMPRTVRTKAEILKGIGSYYDMTGTNYDDAFDDAVDELQVNERIIVIEEFTQDGEYGFLLRNKKK